MQLVEASKTSTRRHIQQANRLAGFDAMACLGHDGAHSELAGGEQNAAPASDGSRRAGAARPLLASPVAQCIDDLANILGIGLADFVQGEQAVIGKHCGAFLAVGSRVPGPLEAGRPPDRTGSINTGGLPDGGIAYEMQPAAFGVGELHQRSREGRRQGQHQQGISHRRCRDLAAPAVESAALAMLFMGTFARLKDHVRRARPDDRVRQHIDGPAPTDLQGTAYLPLWVALLQVARKQLARLMVDRQPHCEQFAPQLGTVARERFHRHRPVPPAARRVLETQQAPEVVAGAVKGLRVDMKRPTHPRIDRSRILPTLGSAHTVPPDTRPELAPGIEHTPIVIDAEAGPFFHGHRWNCRWWAVTLGMVVSLGEQVSQCGDGWNVGRSAWRSTQFRAVAGLYVRNGRNVCNRRSIEKNGFHHATLPRRIAARSLKSEPLTPSGNSG